MATVLQLPPPDTGPAFNEVSTGISPAHAHMNEYASRLSIAEFDQLGDTRYPTLNPAPRPLASVMPINRPGRHADAPAPVDAQESWRDYPMGGNAEVWRGEQLLQEVAAGDQRREDAASASSKPSAQSPNAESTLQPYSTPSGSPPRMSDRVGREDSSQRRPSSRGRSAEASRLPAESAQAPDMGQRSSGLRQSQAQDQYGSAPPSSPRHPALPSAGIGGPSASATSPIVPLVAGPSFTPSGMQVHLSSKPRASAQYPTYITPPPVMNNMNATYTPAQAPREEVCVECAMRDQDMADVDVTGPGVWERDSDVMYEELLHRELEEEAAGIAPPENSSRPRARGMPLSEQNLRVWLSINPKEPSSRQQTLDQYVKSQRTLLEAEALAHARAMREAKQLEEKMRDTYSQLRRSAYELGTTAQLNDDASGVRIKPPRSSSVPAASALAKTDSQGREVTLLENGMIVEHVDVRKEEKEERDRQRREARRDRSRARKSSRGSAIDVASIYSMPVPGSQRLGTNDSGFFSGPKGSESRYSQSFSPRPSSMLTTGERPHMLPRAYSQASFSDMQSIGSSTSPRRSRFFGFKNLTAGWRSQESFAPSGSMMDMHVALQREEQYLQQHPLAEPVSNTPTLRVDDHWVQEEGSSRTATPANGLEPKKKKSGFKKIWKIVTGSKSSSGQKGRPESRSLEKSEDFAPLAPPPPLSYLVDRDRGPGSRRHVSTPSLPTSVSPNPASPYPASLITAPSSIIPSPTSGRHPAPDKDNLSDSRKNSGTLEDHHSRAPSGDASPDLDARGRPAQSSSRTLSSLGPQTPPTAQSRVSIAIRRDKSLPPLPAEAVDFPQGSPMAEGRPQTMFTYGHLPMSFSSDKLQPPQAPFRTSDKRRQSFGGLTSKAMMQSLPVKGVFGSTPVPPFLAEERYSEFGASRFSLRDADNSRGTGTQRSRDITARTKRPRSRFGLSALFGKKSSHGSQSGENGQDVYPNGLRTSGSDREHPVIGNGNSHAHTGSTSAHSGNQRMSVASRKNIAELVDQDPEFVAYRYPSTDARFEVR
ncbi:uncharacterized protein C8Q71DRAFT_704234 [Rhodofomes roseus]|uniref:Proteophosphoglycan ppg4 n=1 Tax=Rhodofomes roseus TaxID=34475 RepID=A0ABQ8KME6_9APHY|nr:uncharacterized protein C8Q71DRAFT_704234 [Rhodofomes roseus]KAH9839386.1 hypothetical protein C8Q71DRAFT_704234 [Rhodofomes roseus]